MYKIAIAGAGAMGGRIGVQLFQGGHDVTLLDYWEEHVERIQQNGLQVKTESDTYYVNVPVKYPYEVNETYDLIIILTKAMHSESMLQELNKSGAIHKETAILSMMNGLGHDDNLSRFIPKSQIFLGVTMWTAGLRGPGQLLLEGTGSIDLQRADGIEDKRTEQIAKVLNDAKLNATISNDVFLSIWSKATLNSVLNPLCTILDKTIKEFSDYPNVREMISPLIHEIVKVANAKNVNIEFEPLLEKIESAYPIEAQGLHYPSMHQDFYRGRQTEIDYLNGKISEYGRELGVPTPQNDLITHLIHELEMKNK